MKKAAGTDEFCDQCQKQSYTSRKRAIFVASRQKLRLYDCPEGNGFHLGHKKEVFGYKGPRGDSFRPFRGSVDEMVAKAAELRSLDT